jgi:glycosyltransferase involved in cell wall biosynthesis
VTELPRFSVLICNWNYADFVGLAIQSALNQTYPADRFEVVVVDDGSTDGSRDVIDRFRGDARMRIVFQENRGQTGAFEAAIKVATGDYVCLLDSDDLFLPTKLARVAAKIAELRAPALLAALPETSAVPVAPVASVAPVAPVAPDRLFLCHDLLIDTTAAGTADAAAHSAAAAPFTQSWFDVTGISGLGDQLTLAAPVRGFPFSIPCGLVFSRNLVADVLAALPCWSFTRGADGILCPAVFLQTGTVHYLHERLGVYRIHASNEFASVVNGRYTPRFDPSVRAPRSLRFLEQWVDLLDQPAPERAVALDYLRRYEHLGRKLSASRQLAPPAVSVVRLGEAAAKADLALNLQSHDPVSFYLVERASDTANAPPLSELSELAQMAQGYGASSSDYIVFMRAGDRLDRDMVERHLHWRQYGALVGVSCNDIRLASATGALVHADVLRTSGAWKQNLQQVPPLATALKDWVAPPMSACMFRRSAFLDRLFESCDSLPPDLQNAGFWLAFQLQHHTSGVLRILETLTTVRLPDGAAASYGYLSAPSGINATLLQPPVAEAAAWLAQFYQQEQPLFRRWLSPAWHQRFVPWLAGQQG